MCVVYVPSVCMYVCVLLSQYHKNPNGVLSEVPKDELLAGGALTNVKGMCIFTVHVCMYVM
jgi:hypothetical protein